MKLRGGGKEIELDLGGGGVTMIKIYCKTFLKN